MEARPNAQGMARRENGDLGPVTAKRIKSADKFIG